MYRKFNKCLYYCMHPKNLWCKIRELIRGRCGKKDSIHVLLNLPVVKLELANNDLKKLHNVVYIYNTNQSEMTISPSDINSIYIELDKGTEFYLILDANNLVIGCIGWQPWRNMIVNLVIDYNERSKGAGLASINELIILKKNKKIYKFNTQVYKKNWRAQNSFFSLGFVVDKDAVKNERYISLTLNI